MCGTYVPYMIEGEFRLELIEVTYLRPGVHSPRLPSIVKTAQKS